MERSNERRGRAATMLFVVALSAAIAVPGAALRLGRSDIPTVFYVSKSDDRNRVDYGVRVDERCRPVGRRPVFAYWRRFEPGEPRLGDLNRLDRQAYGIVSQRVASSNEGGTWITLRIRAVPDEHLHLLTTPTADGGCDARVRMRIDGRPVWLDHAHVQLIGPMMVDHVMFYGRDVETSRPVRHRRSP